MPNRLKVAENILNQMLKGLSGTFPKITDEQRENFYNRFEELANKIALVLPQTSSGTYSGAIGAVIGKCAIKYGTEKALSLIDSVRTCMFRGKSDPARLLWTFMTSKRMARGMSSPEIYCRTVTAARAYCENRLLTDSALRPAQRDIFEWNSDFSAPIGKFNSTVIEPKEVIEELEPREWWERISPIHIHGDLKIFRRQIDDKWEFVVETTNETVALHDDKVEVKIKSDRLNAGRRGLVEKEIVPKSFYTSLEVAECTGYSNYTIRDACNSGRVKAIKLKSDTLGNSSKWTIPYEELLKIKQFGLPKPALEQRKRRGLLKLRDGEVDFAVRRGKNGPVIYPLTETAKIVLKKHAPPLGLGYEWRLIGKEDALTTTWSAFRSIVGKLRAESFNIISPSHPSERSRKSVKLEIN
jgi:hypothetical protein